MGEKKRYLLTRENAQKVMKAALDEIYNAKPVEFRIEMKGAVDEIPMLHVEYDCYAYDAEIGQRY